MLLASSLIFDHNIPKSCLIFNPTAHKPAVAKAMAVMSYVGQAIFTKAEDIILERFIDKELLNWSKQKRFKPLLLRGARQVGKTFTVRKLAKNFDNFIEINFESKPEFREIFKPNLDAHRIARAISGITLEKIVPGKTLLFFDEIQAEPQAILALRYFYEMIPDLHLIAAGSLLDFAIESVGIPVGRVEFLYMYPLSFIEFLNAMGATILTNEILNHKVEIPMENAVHLELLRYVAQYLAIGGMPEAVYSWVTEKDPLICFKIHQTLINSYKQDFSKYAKKFQIKYLDILLRDIPRQVGKKFKFSSVPGEFRKRELYPCLELLATAGIIHKVYCTDAQGLPLGAQIDPDNKLVFLDIALTQSILGLNTAEWLLNPDKQFVNKGEIVEAFVGQELMAYSNSIQKDDLYYWRNQKRGAEAEVDYVINLKQNLVPVEVKSGTGNTLKSMHQFLEKHPDSKFGIKFSTQNYNKFENVLSYPLYAILTAIK